MLKDKMANGLTDPKGFMDAQMTLPERERTSKLRSWKTLKWPLKGAIAFFWGGPGLLGVKALNKISHTATQVKATVWIWKRRIMYGWFVISAAAAVILHPPGPHPSVLGLFGSAHCCVSGDVKQQVLPKPSRSQA